MSNHRFICIAKLDNVVVYKSDITTYSHDRASYLFNEELREQGIFHDEVSVEKAKEEIWWIARLKKEN